MKCVAAAVAMVLLPWAQSTAVAMPCVKAWAMSDGVVAPCTGLLVPESGARDALNCVAVALPRCHADMTYEVAQWKARHGGALSQLEASQEHSAVLQDNLDELLAIEPRPWWDSPGVWFGGGVAIGAGLVTGLVYAMGGVL